jgi:hypothetical protein
MKTFKSYLKEEKNTHMTQGGDGYPTRMMCDFSYVWKII